MDVTFVTLSEFESLLNFKERVFREDKDFLLTLVTLVSLTTLNIFYLPQTNLFLHELTK